MLNALAQLDRKIFLAVNGLNRPWLHYFLGWPTYIGTTVILISLVFAGLLIWDRRNFLKKVAILLTAILISELSVIGLKIFFARPRPFTYFKDISPVNVLFHEPVSFSFPSGHASVMFFTAVLLNLLYNHRLKVLYPVAALVAVTRMYVGVHYPSDILAGASYGTLLGLFSATLIQKKFPGLFPEKA